MQKYQSRQMVAAIDMSEQLDVVFLFKVFADRFSKLFSDI